MASDGRNGWFAEDEAPDGAPALTSTLAEPAIFYDPDTFERATSQSTAAPAASDTPGAPGAGALANDLSAAWGAPNAERATGETLAELAPTSTPTASVAEPARDVRDTDAAQPAEPDSDELWASLTEAAMLEPGAGGVGALRSLLLGRDSDVDERLALVEKRLEQVALYVTGEVQTARMEAARVTDLRQRLDAVAARVEAALDLARGGDVSVHALDALRHQVDELRADQDELTQSIDKRLQGVEVRTRLRQHQDHTARRVELLRLRQRVYAPDTFGSSRLRAIDQRAHERAMAAAGGSDLAGPRLSAVRHGHDAGAAWHVFTHGVAVFFGTLFTLIVVLARVTGDQLRDAWDHLMALFARD